MNNMMHHNIPDFSIPNIIPPRTLSKAEKEVKFKTISELLKKNNAIVVAHFYTPSDVQELAEQTGGCVADSLAMARFGLEHSASTLIVCGVRFMGESAKILSPGKRVFMPELKAECSLDLSCPADQFAAFCDLHPDRTVVVYANTSARVKAHADWVVTSSNALDIVKHLDGQGEKILWAPDRHLGSYIERETGADMLIWQGSCVVHEAFKAEGIKKLKKQYPTAAVLAHPESPEAVLALADAIGSTAQILKAAQKLNNPVLIIATESGLFYKLHQVVPDKLLLEAPNAGYGATCKSCARCPWMLMNDLEKIEKTLKHFDETNEIYVDAKIIERAARPLRKMVEFIR